MHSRRTRLIAGLLAASALALPGAAQAAGPREADLVARLERLEAEMAQLRADLQTAKTEAAQSAAAAQVAAQAAATQSEQAASKIAALEARPQAPSEGFRAGATTIKLGGYIKLIAANTRYSEGEVATNSLGRDFYLPQHTFPKWHAV